MVQLARSDVLTSEVLDWKGLHLFHFQSSSCSQKTRIFLRLKGLDVTLHHVNLAAKKNQEPWYMGINPRGLVPTLVHDGKVIIESNDILEYLEQNFPEPSLIPEGREAEVSELLSFEDDLHMDLRTVTMRFVIPSFMVMRKESELERYESTGSGQVGGEVDAAKAKEVEFWRAMQRNGGITDQAIQESVGRFRAAFTELNGRLESSEYLLGDSLSLLDIAWFIYAHRLQVAGYPLARLHPKLASWFAALQARPEFAAEIKAPPPMKAITGVLHAVQSLRGGTLSRVAAL